LNESKVNTIPYKYYAFELNFDNSFKEISMNTLQKYIIVWEILRLKNVGQIFQPSDD